MLIGYVSDERYVALPDVMLEFVRDGKSFDVRSRASGSVHADLEPGDYDVTLQKPGFGGKRTKCTVRPGGVHHFRMLSDCLLGYAWPKWIRAGDKSEFRVHSVEAYKLELWRYGLKREFIRNLGWYDEHGPRATMQVVPDGDYSQSGVRWNKQGYNIAVHNQYLEAPARSGLYYFQASTAGGAKFSFPWIVAPAKPTARLAVLASNITWNAYNSFGGRSNYIHTDQLPATPTVNSRQELARYSADFVQYGGQNYLPLSFDRPEPINHIDPKEEVTDPIEGRAACHIAPAEWRLLGWLEREGFDYDFYAETQLDGGQLDLANYRVLILSTHPEYWSHKMYQRLKRWVFEEGGRLLYLGGNGLNCEVEFLHDMANEKLETAAMVVQNGDDREVKRLGLDSRMHQRRESEANLLGVVFTETGAMTAAPFRVIDEKHWVFAGTGLKQGEIFGRNGLHRRCEGGASGHETDKVSSSSPKNVHLLAKGMNRDEGGADMIYFDTPSGGQVFSASSITWPTCLLVDEQCSKITANVIKRFLG